VVPARGLLPSPGGEDVPLPVLVLLQENTKKNDVTAEVLRRANVVFPDSDTPLKPFTLAFASVHTSSEPKS